MNTPRIYYLKLTINFQENELRKRDKIKGHLPYLVGGMYFLLLKWLVDAININTNDYMIYLIALWAFVTACSVMVLEEGIDIFDASMEDGLGEDEE